MAHVVCLLAHVGWLMQSLVDYLLFLLAVLLAVSSWWSPVGGVLLEVSCSCPVAVSLLKYCGNGHRDKVEEQGKGARQTTKAKEQGRRSRQRSKAKE